MQRWSNADEPQQPENTALSAVEEQGIVQALKSIEAGEGLPFDEVMRELENDAITL